MTNITEVLDNVGGAAMIAGHLLLRPLLQDGYRRWHTTGEEAGRALPGDERVPNALIVQTLAITIQARAADIWPWLVQIGQERGGLYSYEMLENLARCQMRNAERIVPEWELHLGDRVRLGPPVYPVHSVVGLEQGRWLLLAGANPKTGQADPLPQPGQVQYTNFSWVLFLDEQIGGATRLLTRTRLDYAPRSFGLKLVWEWLTDPIGFVMTRKMLLGVKQRAERPHLFPQPV